MSFTSDTQTAAYTGFAVVFPFMQRVYTQLVPALALLYIVFFFHVYFSIYGHKPLSSGLIDGGNHCFV